MQFFFSKDVNCTEYRIAFIKKIMFPHHFRKLGISSLPSFICSFVSFFVGAFHVKTIKNSEIYKTVSIFMKFGVSVYDHESMHPTNC